MWDIVLALRLGKLKLPIVYGMATDDAHGYHAFGVGKVNPGRGWIMVKAPYLTAETIVPRDRGRRLLLLDRRGARGRAAQMRGAVARDPRPRRG